MNRLTALAVLGSASLAAMALVLTPASAAGGSGGRAVGSLRGTIGSFTPATADPRLAAALARRGSASTTAFRFTPATAAVDPRRGVRVAVRARASTPQEAARSVVQMSSAAPAVTAVTPSSYNLGVSVGWRRFAVSGDVAESQGGIVPGRTAAAGVGLSYAASRRLTGRLRVSAETSEGRERIAAEEDAVAVDVGGSYSIARNLEVTGGVRYRMARDPLEPVAQDRRRDSQAVYIGTAFRF